MKKFLKDKLYISNLIPYFIIGILPIVISLLWIFNYYKIVSDEIKTSQEHILSQMKNSFDDDINTIVSTGQLLSDNAIVCDLMNTEDFSNTDLLEAIQLEDE